MSNERVLSQDYENAPSAPPLPSFAFVPDAVAHSNDTSSYDIIKLLSLLQQVNPTRSALLQQLHQLILYIEQDKRFTQDEKDVILNTELRGTIQKLEEDFKNRGFNRPNCPLRRDLMFHYANLFFKYQEMTAAKKNQSTQSIYNAAPVVAAIPEAIAVESIKANSSLRQRNNATNSGVRSENVFNSRLDLQRDLNERDRQLKKEKDEKNFIVLILIVGFLYFLYKKMM